MNFWDWLKRERHTRGYGVHSPLAFRLLWRVVRPDREVAFYGEERLRHEWGERCSRRELSRALMLLRLVCDLRPSRVWVSGSLPPVFETAIREAGGVLKIVDSKTVPGDVYNADMVMLFKSKLRKEVLRRLFEAEKTVVGFNVTDQVVDSVKDAVKSGVMLEAGNAFVAIGKEGVMPHCYSVNF